MKKPIELKLKVIKGGFASVEIGFAVQVMGEKNEHVLMLPDKYDEYKEDEIVKVVISEPDDEKDRKIEELENKVGGLEEENDSLKNALDENAYG